MLRPVPFAVHRLEVNHRVGRPIIPAKLAGEGHRKFHRVSRLRGDRPTDCRIVHGAVYAGDGVVWLPPELAKRKLASQRSVGGATGMTAVAWNYLQR